MATKFIEAVTREQLDKVFAFRYNVVCEKLGIAALDDCEPGYESDEYDRYAIQFAAFGEDGAVQACVRLIHHSPIGYPTENNMRFTAALPDISPERVCELSRIFVGRDYRGFTQTKALLDGLKQVVYPKLVELDIEYAFGALEKPFLKLLNIFRVPYRAIGEEQEYVGLRYPCIMYTRDLGSANAALLLTGDAR